MIHKYMQKETMDVRDANVTQCTHLNDNRWWKEMFQSTDNAKHPLQHSQCDAQIKCNLIKLAIFLSFVETVALMRFSIVQRSI